MRLGTYVVAVALTTLLAACGGDEAPAPAKAPAPPAKTPAASPPGQAKAPGTGKIVVGCVAKWDNGTQGSFVCTAANKAPVTKDNVLLEKICVTDPRLTKYGFDGGQTAPIVATGNPPCAQLGEVKRLPETCFCAPPAGGDCAAPKGGFICVAAGRLATGGTP